MCHMHVSMLGFMHLACSVFVPCFSSKSMHVFVHEASDLFTKEMLNLAVAGCVVSDICILLLAAVSEMWLKAILTADKCKI